ncbi:anti sigma-E protein RseA domain-containing protein [Catenovulum agarivorans DS-2]|uniref:Anti-sigma-E factor RseA n=1 Tax=Catenovulum agarivorans DS-2 TaxID=1328313 RepID=W7QSJ6_9ALTE|nr:RseA family anti-sigma factor [Catenovulum agarivorans]EWH12002.1 anti sigma-E protein RseA domain-containing protein [Catenovulum agarivorans DS-2]
MSSKSKENISAFVDGQQDNPQVIDKMKQDPKLAECFGRYHMIGDAMRNELPSQLNLGIADSVMQAIDKEPVVLAPNARQTANQAEQAAKSKSTTSSKVVQLFKPALQYGLAASFAAALVVGFQIEQNNTSVEVPQPVLQTFPIGGSLDPVSMQQVQSVQSVSSYDAMQQRQRINAYIMDHAQQLKTRQHEPMAAKPTKTQLEQHKGDSSETTQ